MILFITRKHPPAVGGMEQLSYHLVTHVGRQVPTYVIKWGGSQKWLPVFLPYALLRALWALVTRPVELIHISDPVLAPLGLFLRTVSRLPVVVNVHGLDILYTKWMYQHFIPACVRRLDHAICISQTTRDECVARGIEEEQTTVIPVGVDAECFTPLLSPEEEAHWLRHWDLIPRPTHLLLTVGRLVPRKGVVFFVSQVLPALARRQGDWAYLVVGEGPEQSLIEAAVQEQGLVDRVRVLGRVSHEELRAAYSIADLFVMPNIPVEGDAEGFGIVTLEARAAGLPVVASALEGIVDSFTSTDDGILVPPGDAGAFVQAIEGVLDRGISIEERIACREQVMARFSWTSIAGEYLEVFRAVRDEYSDRHHSIQDGK